VLTCRLHELCGKAQLPVGARNRQRRDMPVRLCCLLFPVPQLHVLMYILPHEAMCSMCMHGPYSNISSWPLLQHNEEGSSKA